MVKPTKAAPPDRLIMRLFDPGMTVLHRAGLGGLACTLRYIQRAWESGALLDEDVPGFPWRDDTPSWEVAAQTVTLDFEKPESACDYLKRLFKVAFGLKDRLMYLPGQYGDMPPPLAVRAEIQAGLTLTFLQHGKTRGLAKQSVVVQCDPNGDGRSLITVEYKPCDWYKHQSGWEALCDSATGDLRSGSVEVIGPLNPGAVVRHVAFTAATRIEEPPERVLPLYFALVGCLALPVNRGMGVLVVPDVEDLHVFAQDRPFMTPHAVSQCRIASAGDAALQAQVRLRGQGVIEENCLPGCFAARFRPTSWASQQKSRVEALSIDKQEVRRFQPSNENQAETNLRMFETALAVLPPRLRIQTSEGEGDRRHEGADKAFWSDSAVRPLIADNLALGRRWYQDFSRLMYANDSNGRPLRNRVRWENEGLKAMTQQPDFLSDPESILVKAVHEAIRRNLARIKKDTDGEGPVSQATFTRWDRFRERLRLSLVGAKTPDQCRNALCTLFGNARQLKELQAGWHTLLPMLRDDQWQLARDLGLLALASYSKKQKRKPKTNPDL